MFSKFQKRIFNIGLLFTLLLSFNAYSQRTIVKGHVKDAITSVPIPFATIFFDESSIGTITDIDGYYIIITNDSYSTLKVLSIGYKPLSIEVVIGKEQVLDIKLQIEAKQLKEVVVRSEKTKYRNKDNPAVELIKKVIENKENNSKVRFDFYEYEKYEKVQFALSNVTEKFKNKKIFKKFQFVFDNMDTTKMKDNPVLPIYLKESISDVIYRKSPNSKKEIVKANKVIDFEGYLDNQGINGIMKYLYQDINIYDNNIAILSNQFLSPVSPAAPVFYKFFITDTLFKDNVYYTILGFVPRNKEDFLFQGYMLIPMDSSYAVAKIEMGVNEKINLNWVKELKILQEFENKEGQGYTLVNDEFSCDFGLSKGNMGIYGQRTVSYKNHIVNATRPEDDFKGLSIETKDSASFLADDYWVKNRHLALSKTEKGVYITIDSVKQMPIFKHSFETLIVLFAGYKKITPYFNLGPIGTFYSYNPVEGLRLRFGGKTSNDFSKKIVLESYGAYGFKDEKWKYYFGTTYSFTKRSIYEFPVQSLKASYQRETKIPGQELQFVQEDNIFLSIKRGVNDKWLYNDIFNLEYLHEFNNHFSFTLGYKNWTQQAAGGLHFNRVDYTNSNYDIKDIQTSEVSVGFRWAPNESFYQGRTFRIPISFKNPIFNLRYIQGLKGVLGGEYNYHNITLNIFKRVYMSQLGYTDVVLEGGKIFGKVAFPLLNIHRANQSYSYQLQSYNLMNFLEFVSDQYVSANIDHSFNGFFFNKIPLIKKLKWREGFTVKILYGSLNATNTPHDKTDILKLPTNQNNTPVTYSLSEKPYIEGSISISNIFKFFRVDLIKRLTYLDHPDISKIGVRARFKIDF